MSRAFDPEDVHAEARRYLKRELAMGRGRVLVPSVEVAPVAASVTAAATGTETPAAGSSKPVRTEESPVPAKSVKTPPVKTPPAKTPPAKTPPAKTPPAKTPPAKTPDAKGPAAKTPKPENQPLSPFTALRTDEVVASVAAALATPGEEAATCTACELAKTRNTVVFGTGSGRSGIVFIGEAPGANEDAQGVPFVGRAGQLLDRILAAIGIQREDVYICNVLKCRPPGNRDPRPEEAAACAPFLRVQLNALQPRVLCALGLHATRWLLPTKLPMAKLRGQVLEYDGIPTLATYHPAALLRNPGLKPKAWEDFKLLRTVAEEAAEREAKSDGA